MTFVKSPILAKNTGTTMVMQVVIPAQITLIKQINVNCPKVPVYAMQFVC